MADPRPPGDGMTPFIDALKDLSRRIDNIEAATGTQRALSVDKLPILGANTQSNSGFGLAAGWQTYATVTIPVPIDKTQATVVAIANGAAVDLTTGGVTTLSARIIINSSTSVAAPAAKDAGASAVNNIFTIAHSVSFSSVAGSITGVVQINPLNFAAFSANPGNFAQISVFASFSI